MTENYDTGGQGVAYNVTAVNGTTNSYRSDGVDLEAATAPATGNDLGWTAGGQWFKYTVNVATPGTYTVTLLVAAPAAVTDAFHLSNSAGTNLSGNVNIVATGGWQVWKTVTANVTLPAGTQTLTLHEDNAGWNVDSMAFAATSSGGGGGGGTGEAPYGGTAAAIPGTVLAEKYDTGGQGVGYNVTATNGTDNGFRSDGVDLETTSAPGGGNNIGWTAAGQWFRYTVNVATAGTYTVTFEVASVAGVTDGFHLSNSAGTNLTGSVNVPATGAWQTWTTVTATVTLPVGQQVLTWNQDNAGYNLYSMAFASGSGGGGGGTGGTNDESCAGVSPITVNGRTYNPTWCLEFNGPVGPPSTTATNFDFGNNGGWGNGEAEFYCGYPGMANNPAQCPTTFSTATAPVYVDGNGHLVIQPRNVGGTWISARLNTDPAAAGNGPKLFQYGILEASIKLPDMNPQGIWPAFWALGNNSNAGVVWPTCGETDILEDWSPAVFGGAGDAGENSTIHTMDTGGDGISTRYLFPGGEAVNTGFHTYGQIWSANEVQYFVDNPSAPFATLTPGSLPAGDVWPFNQPFFMIMNVAVGGTLGGSDAGINPGPMTVDYIRYYQ